MKLFHRPFPVLLLMLAGSAGASERTLAPTVVPVMKAVYGEVQARDRVLARARVGGTLVALDVTEGDEVKAGQVIARIVDDRTDFEVAAIDARLQGLQASLVNVRADLDRARQLVERGAATVQRVDQLKTQANVAENEIAAARAQRSALTEQAAQGAVLAPTDGKVLSVPVTRSAVVMPGETVAILGGGGFFLRLAIPERHAAALRAGSAIVIEAAGRSLSGTLARIYPEIQAGRVTADVEVDGLETRFVGTRVLVKLPVGSRPALLVPTSAVSTRSGLDFVKVIEAGVAVDRVVIVGDHEIEDGSDSVEILSGLRDGDRILTP